MNLLKSFVLLIFLLFTVFNVSLEASQSRFDLVCGNDRSEVVIMLNKTVLNDYEGFLEIGRDHYAVNLKKNGMSRGIVAYRDHNFQKEIKVDFKYDLRLGKADIIVKTQFNETIVNERIECR